MTASPPAIIVVEDLAKRFAGGFGISGLSFACARGEIFGFVGPDGAGKTTIMRLLGGVMTPDRGSILIDGVDVVADPETAKRHISYMPQRFGLYEDLTVDENIEFFADLFEIDPTSRDERAARLLEASGMTPFRKRRAGQLSGGMKQRKKQIGGRYLARVRGAFGKLRVPQRIEGLQCVQSAAAMK